MQKIVQQLNDKNQKERWLSVVALEKIGEPAMDYLVSSLKDGDKWVRYAAVDALGNIGHANAVEHLITVLNDLDQDVRFAAAEALGKIGDPKAIEPLNNVCTSDNCYVKIAAEDALSQIKK